MILLVSKHTCPRCKKKKKKNPTIQNICFFSFKSSCITILQSFTQWQFCYWIDINKFYPYSSDQSVPIADWWEWLKSFISFLYGSVIIVTKVCNIKPFDLTLNNSTSPELDFLLQWPCCNFSPLMITITFIPKLFLFVASNSYLHIVKGKVF